MTDSTLSTNEMPEIGRREESGTQDRLPEYASVESLYRLLGTLYLEIPDGSVVEEVKKWVDQWQEMDDHRLPSEARDIIEIMESGLANDDLNQEFTRLFMGLHEVVSPKPPYESMYREGCLFGNASDEVVNAYRSEGLVVDSTQINRPPDHIGYELVFLAELCEQESTAIQQGDRQVATVVRNRQYDFLTSHPGTWFEDLFDECLEYDPGDFYYAVLRLTRYTLYNHRRSLEESRPVSKS